MMKKRTLLMSALAVVLAAGMTIAPAMAYFTAHTDASGSVAVELGDKTTIDEDVDGWNKAITIHNEGPESVYVRARAFAGSELQLDYSGSGWSSTPDEDGWYYYTANDGIVPADGDTTTLNVAISNIPTDVVDGDEVNVSVVYECAKVIYVDNEAQPADWDMEATTTEGGED